MAQTQERDFYSVAEAAERLGVGHSTVWRWIAAGKLPAYRVGLKNIRIKKRDLESVIQPARARREEVTAMEQPSGPTQIAQRRRVRLVDPERQAEIFADYDPGRVREALKQSAGALAGIDRLNLLSDLRAARHQESNGRPS